MWQRVVIVAGVTGLFVAAAFARGKGDSEFDSYYDGKQYKFVISEAQQARCPRWDPRAAPNPPYSAAKALKQARQFIGTIVTTKDTFWQFEELALVDVSGGWAWRAKYELTLRGGSTGVWPTMDCWILMDGTVIKPILKKHKGNMD